MTPTLFFDESLEKLQFIFRYSGLTFESEKLTPKNKLKTRCVYLLNFFWLNFGIVGAIYYVIDGIQTGKMFVELTYEAPCITYSFLTNLKAFFLIYYEDTICDLIDDLRKLEIKDGDSRDDMKRDDVNFLHSVLKSSNILNVVLILTFIASPLILIAIKYYISKEVELILPFLITYPFDSHDISYWPFVYVHQFWSVSIVLLNICAADYLLYVCCTYIGIQFKLLQQDTEKVIEQNFILLDHELEEFKEKCLELIKWHQELIRSANLLGRIYGESTLFNFVSSSILICLTGFNVMAIQNIAFTVTFLVFLSASLLQIYMLCFFGDFLMKSSMDVSNAVYNSRWYYLNSSTAKYLLFILCRAQKPCKLTAFGYSDVNLKAFMSILSSAWSYFALLKTVYTPQVE